MTEGERGPRAARARAALSGRLNGGVERLRDAGEGLREGGERLRDGAEGLRARVEDMRAERERPRQARTVSGRERAEGARDGAELAAERTREAAEDAGWFLREKAAWPLQDGYQALGRRGRIGVFGGFGAFLAIGIAVLLLISAGASDQTNKPIVAIATSEPTTVPVTPTPAPEPAPKKVEAAPKPSGPTLHGAPPVFSPAEDVESGVGAGKAVGSEGGTGGVGAQRGARKKSPRAATASSTNETPASSARIGATPTATATAQAQADALRGEASGDAKVGDASEPSGPPAPKAAKAVAREFSEAFVVYETGGVDSEVRHAFGQTSTKQLAHSLLRRPPRQPATVKVPQAKVVNVVAGPSKGSVYSLSVSLLRVGVTSELRLQMERGVGKQWQVTNVLG
jgi:hypothetical protein